MSLLDQLREMVATMPSGSSVSLPIDWLRIELDLPEPIERERARDVVERDYAVDQVAEILRR